MDRNNLDSFYAENSGLIHAVARKGYNRLQAIGASADYEDLVQDLSLVFIKAYDQFDPEHGKFSTYFVPSAYHAVNKIAAKFEIERCELGIRSVEEIDERFVSAGIIEDADFLSTIDSGSLSPEQFAINRSAVEYMVKTLSPLAQEIAAWIINPPEFVGVELDAHQAHADFARANGHVRRNKAHLGMTFICDMMEMIGVATASELRRARLELQQVIEKECEHD